ncbi:14743_t:CDS:2, partial [Dentiscutata heterogama]
FSESQNATDINFSKNHKDKVNLINTFLILSSFPITILLIFSSSSEVNTLFISTPFEELKYYTSQLKAQLGCSSNTSIYYKVFIPDSVVLPSNKTSDSNKISLIASFYTQQDSLRTINYNNKIVSSFIKGPGDSPPTIILESNSDKS